MLRSGLKVLIVDDEPEVRSTLRFELEFHGCKIFEAVDGKDGLEQIRAHAPELILSDIRMPNLDGIQMLDALRSTGTTTPVVLMSGFADVPVWETYARGADAFVAKPFRTEALGETLDRVLTPIEQRTTDNAFVAALSLSLDFQSWDEAARMIAWGRGGLFATVMPPGIRRDKLIALKLTVGGANGQTLLAQGIVRWVRPSGEPGLPAGAGIEIITMQGNARPGKSVLGVESVAFIPRSVKKAA